jgi:hypothetical protein
MYVCTYVYTHVYTHITKRHHGRRGHRARLHMNWWPTLACICACMRDVCCKEHIRGHLLGLHLVVVVFAAPYHKTLHGVKTKKKNLGYQITVGGERQYVGPLLEWVRRRTSPEQLVHACLASFAPVSSRGL